MRHVLLIALLAGGVGGCGDGLPKPRELTADEQDRFNKEQKTIEDEERGPAQPKGKAKGKKL
jgi:hypothetical protein